MGKPEVSIIIVNYNVEAFLLKCLFSIFNTKGKLDVEVIVVDNASDDNSVDLIRNKFPQVIILENKINIGFPAANNQALQIAKGEFIFLLNPDTELIEDSISVLKVFLESSDEVDIAAPQLLNSDGSVQDSIFRFPRLRYIVAEMLYMESLTKSKYYPDKNFKKCFEVNSASGAALFFRKKLIDKIGQLNEKLFWIEDIDFCFRTVKSGGKVYYVPLTRIIHYSGQSAKKNYNISISSQVINKIKFYKVHGNTLELFLVYFISLINVLVRFIFFSILSPFKRIYSLKMSAYMYTLPRIFTATKGL